MRSSVLFYNFETKAKPGKIIAHGIRFESIEIEVDHFDQTQFKLLCDQHEELKQFNLQGFKMAVARNFPSL